MWQKCIIKFFAFVVNSVISISIHFCPVLFIYLFIYSDLRPYMTHQNFQGGMLWAGWDRFVQCQILTPVSSPHPERAPYKKKNVISRGPHGKFCAQCPEFLVTALDVDQNDS